MLRSERTDTTSASDRKLELLSELSNEIVNDPKIAKNETIATERNLYEKRCIGTSLILAGCVVKSLTAVRMSGPQYICTILFTTYCSIILPFT